MSAELFVFFHSFFPFSLFCTTSPLPLVTGISIYRTTKMAPHLDGVHVVFGLVISGFEVIKKIEGLKTDSASRPYADVRVVDCGQLITKSANDVLEGKRKRPPLSADSSFNSNGSSSHFSSSVESESEANEKRKHYKHKRHAKSKKPKKKRIKAKKEEDEDVLLSSQRSHRSVEKEMLAEESTVGEEKEQGGKREKPVVRPEEIPPVPENRFLLRRDMPTQDNETQVVEKEEKTPSADQKPAVSKSGRKIRGRGTIRYHTPTRSKSRSASVEERGSSETPPHWKEEMKRTKMYQPPSIERWSKGDKLNDHSSSRWEDRSDTAWSRSADHSSDRSSEMSSQCQKPKKQKKKAKHKKKAKKCKHARKKSLKNKPQEHNASDGEGSVSSVKKSRKSRSPTRSPSSLHHSPTRRRRRSSLSYSGSYSRSYTSSRSRSRERSRSYSKSRSFSGSRSRSLSRSRSQFYSKSRSRSRSRSRYRSRSRTLSSSRKSLSRSPRKRKTSKSKSNATTRSTKRPPESKKTPVSRLPAVPTAERAPVIPLSDSPPPSRWKPDQKPWKPSYIHIQEIKAKVASNNSSSTGQAVVGYLEEAQTSGTPRSAPGELRGEKPAQPAQHSLSRSSRSKSYSRSHSRSSSRSRSRSPRRSKSRSSSNNRSDSASSQKSSSNIKNSLDKEWKEYYSSLKRIQNLDKYIQLKHGQDDVSGSEKGTGSVCSPNISVSVEKSNVQDPETKHDGSLPTESLNSRSEWDSDSDKVAQSNNTVSLKNQKQDAQLSEITGWNSESDSERVKSRMVANSEKEEGEASSESDDRGSKKLLDDTVVHKIIAAAFSSGESDEGPETAAQPAKHKSKKKGKKKHKHKRREQKTCSHHSKKKAKKKHQKLKETFHWQPPLEFGEDDEDELLLLDFGEEEKDKLNRNFEESPDNTVNKKSRNSPNLSKNCTKEEERVQQRSTKESHQCNRTSVISSRLLSAKEQDSLDDMDICTPEHDVDIFEPSFAGDVSNNASAMTAKSSDMADQSAVASTATAGGLQDEAPAGKPAISFKWKPLKGISAPQSVSTSSTVVKNTQTQETQAVATQGVRMEIKSKSLVRPGSLFDEVRKTARLNQRPRNQDSSSEESSPSVGKTKATSRTRSPKKSRSVSTHRSGSRGWSRSSSRSRSRSSSYSSRSRSRSRRRHGRGRSRSRSSTYRTYRSHSRTYSRSLSRGRSSHHRRRSRSDSSDSYSSRSASRRRRHRRSDSYRSSERRSRSSRSSSRSSSRRRSHSRSSRYS